MCLVSEHVLMFPMLVKVSGLPCVWCHLAVISKLFQLMFCIAVIIELQTEIIFV